MKILLIEPNHLLAQQYSEVLEPSEVIWCRDAQGAILAIDKQKPDLIISELLMSKHSGVEFLYELRTYPEWHKIPVVILSRVNLPDSCIDQASIKKLGIVEYLYKPKTSLSKLADTANNYSPLKT